AEPDINPRQIVERPALARQPAEQQKAGAGAQPLGQASKKSAERRQRKMLRPDLGKIGVAERAEVANRFFNSPDLFRGKNIKTLLLPSDLRPFPARGTSNRPEVHSTS